MLFFGLRVSAALRVPSSPPKDMRARPAGEEPGTPLGWIRTCSRNSRLQNPGASKPRSTILERPEFVAAWTSQDSLNTNATNAHESDCALGTAPYRRPLGLLF